MTPLRFSPSGDLIEPCAYQARCGRPLGHRGHHGGWRSGTSVVAPNPVQREPQHATAHLGAELTPRELAVIAEYLYHGRYKDVAACMGLAEQTIKNHGGSALSKTGAGSIASIAHHLGWTNVPDGLLRPHDAA